MATIRKRQWRNRDGSTSSAYVLGYQDRDGRWVRQQYPTRREADAARVRVEAELARGVHVADRDSVTVRQAVAAWLDDYRGLVDRGHREQSTLDAYRAVSAHVLAHAIADARLSRLSTPDVTVWVRWLERERSPSQTKRALGLLRAALGHAVEVGWCSLNAATEARVRGAGSRHREEVRIPSKDDVRRLLDAAREHGPRAHAMVSLLVLCGLRASELRGLRRDDVTANAVRVRQRADRYQRIGSPKSRTSRRDVPLPPGARAVVLEWMLQAPQGSRRLVFPSSTGSVWSYPNLWRRLWVPLMRAAELVDEQGAPLWGLHALRHVAVSLWIEQGVAPKTVSTWAGHASVAFTLDVYGHLWREVEGEAALAAAVERSLLG